MQATRSVGPVRPITPVRMGNTQNKKSDVQNKSGQCDFCGKNTSSLTKVNSIEKTFEICPDCLKRFKEHKCIMCSASTVDELTHRAIEWKGLCSRCKQMVMVGAAKLKMEQEMGVDFESTMEVIPDRDQDMSDEELSNWLSSASKIRKGKAGKQS